MTYHLTSDATLDIEEIIRYTVERWGVDSANDYIWGMLEKFNEIGEGTVIPQLISKRFSNAYILRFRKHFIFYRLKIGEIPEIFGVIHQKRDIVSLLKKRIV